MSSTPAISVGIRLYGKDLDPDNITSVLGIEPTNSGRVGDRIRNTRVRSNTGLWSFSVHSDVDNVPDCIDRVLAVFEEVREPLTSLPGVTRGSLAIFVGLDSPDGWNWEGFEIASDTLVRISTLALSLATTVSTSPTPKD